MPEGRKESFAPATMQWRAVTMNEIEKAGSGQTAVWSRTHWLPVVAAIMWALCVQIIAPMPAMAA